MYLRWTFPVRHGTVPITARGQRRRIDLTIKDALDAGSDYGEIATACGVSRQAIRQRWLQRTAGSRWFEVWRPSPRPGGQVGVRPHAHEPARAVCVRLADGPHDGAREMAFPGEVLRYEADSPPSESSGSVPLLAWYAPSRDDANVYVFAGVERDAWRMYTGRLLGSGPHFVMATDLGLRLPACDRSDWPEC